ncbi:pectate lyase [Alteromonadaceae bacterium 2753L.S.0a.02]|nr:pectate lyase [Alteromonadaceae bacterium 2753L.S.0a.02]
MKKFILVMLCVAFSVSHAYAQVLSDGRYVITSRHSELVLDVEDNSLENGANIQQWGYAANANQHFDLVSRGSGYYSIISVSSGKAVDVYNMSQDAGGEIRQWEYWGGDGQLWKLSTSDNEYFTITSKLNGLNLDVWQWSTAPGGDIRQWTATGAANQQFSFEKITADACEGLASGGLYKITNYSSKKSLDIASYSNSNGANLLQWNETGGANQQFYLEQLSGTDRWVIKASHSGLVLEVADASSSNGANIQQWAYTEGAHQQWRLQQSAEFDGAYAIISVGSGKALTVAGSDAGDNIYQNSDAANSSQRWYITALDSSCSGSSGGSRSNNYSAGVNGFAAQYGADGLSTTTGGGNNTAVQVSSCSQLQSLVQNSSAKVIQLPNSTLDCRTAARTQAVCKLPCGSGYTKPLYRIPTSSQSCVDLGGSNSDLINLTRNESTLSVGSNTTIIGSGSASKVIGASFDLSGSSNVILKNFTIADVNPALIEAGDAISLDNSSHIWIDHMRMTRISDGLLDSYDSANVTISWSHFDGINTDLCWGTDPYVSMLKNTQATFHHNFFDSGYGRNPKILGSSSRVHLYNNYWKDIYYFSMSVSDSARAKVEGNYYQDANRPHWNEGGYIDADVSSNRYTGKSTSSSQDDSGSSSWDVGMYSYSLDNVDKLPSTIPAGVGPN